MKKSFLIIVKTCEKGKRLSDYQSTSEFECISQMEIFIKIKQFNQNFEWRFHTHFELKILKIIISFKI